MLVGYVRVSRHDQDLTQKISVLESIGCECIFEEKQSGKNVTQRAESQAMLAYVRKGDVLVVTKLDPLSRSLPDMLAITDRSDTSEAGLRLQAEAVVTATSPAGRLVFQTFAVVVEFERARLRERTLEGLDRARSQEKQSGRPKSRRATQIRHLKRLRDKGVSFADLSSAFNISKASALRYCRVED